ncbi:MAG: hypothetical protein ACE5DM_02765 [Candidatus Nanoarchaeia archaeon]
MWERNHHVNVLWHHLKFMNDDLVLASNATQARNHEVCSSC